jgi:hypothetical protein
VLGSGKDACPVTPRDWLTVFFVLALMSLIPVVWAIVDVARRPAWQFSAGRKVMWGVSLGIGWLVLWPVALISSILYLTVLRRRFPPTSGAGPWGGGPSGGYGPSGGGGPSGGYGPSGGGGPSGGYGPWGGGSSGGYGQSYGPSSGYGPSVEPGAPGGPGSSPELPPYRLPPAGWYPDPAGSGKERWWDGKGWTEHLR